MMHALFNTIGIYKFPIKEHGTHVHFLYDVTQQETDWSKANILKLMSLATETDLKRLDKFDLLNREPFQTWMEEKHIANKNTAIVWMLIWCSMVVVYLISVLIVWDSRSKLIYDIVIICTAGSTLALEVLGLYTSRDYLKTLIKRLREGRIPVVLIWGYKMFQILFLVHLILHHSLTAIHLECTNLVLRHILLFMQVMMILYGFMGIMFFTQLSEVMGHYLTIMEKMMKSSLSFLLIGLLIILSFAMTFYLLCLPEKCPASLNAPNASRAGNDDNSFSSYLLSIYSTFLLSMAIAAPQQWHFEDTPYPYCMMILYMTCLTLMGIISINLLIAVMNERVIELCRHKESILKIQQLTIFLTIEDKTMFIQRSKFAMKYFKVLAPKTVNIHKDESSGKMFLHTTEHLKAN